MKVRQQQKAAGKGSRKMGKVILLFCFLLVYAGTAFGAPIILNEYNAVGGGQYLEGASAYDPYFGRVLGNGGDWFELVVTADHLDMRRWGLDIYESGSFDETLRLTNHSIWSDLRIGTIITISEDVADDISYNPIYDPLDSLAGDWWINVQAATGASGLYIEGTNFPVNNNDPGWQLIIRDAVGAVMFGPVGEGVIPNGPGVNNMEIFRLEANPSASITPLSNYDDGRSLSTFGAPNRWGNTVQDFSELRSVVPEPATVLLLGLGGLALLRKRRA